MENQTNHNFKNSLLNQPRGAVSGLVYSISIVGMALIGLAFALTIAAVANATGTNSNAFSEQDWYKYLSYLLYQIVYVFIVVVFATIYRSRPREFGYRKTHWKYYAIALLLQFGLLFGLNWVNNLFIMAIEAMGGEIPVNELPSLGGGGIVGVLLVVAVFPAICEETIFRGVILEGVKDLGTVAACLLCGLLFSIFHQNPLQTVYQFLCGSAFALLAIRADSILPAIVAHFANNALIIFDARFQFLEKVGGAGNVVLLVVALSVLCATLAYLIFFDKKTNRKKEGAIKPFLLFALTGIILSAIIWISVFVTYFM